MASAPPQSEPDAPAPPKSKKKEHRQFDTWFPAWLSFRKTVGPDVYKRQVLVNDPNDSDAKNYINREFDMMSEIHATANAYWIFDKK